MTNTTIAATAGALVLGGLVTAQAMRPTAMQSSRSVPASSLEAATGPVLVNCGPGRRVVVTQTTASFGSGEQKGAQIDCVSDASSEGTVDKERAWIHSRRADDVSGLPVTVDAFGRPIAALQGQAMPMMMTTTPYAVPVAYGTDPMAINRTAAPPATRVVYRDRPVSRAAAPRARAAQTRSWKKSALIIGGSAAGGAGLGAILDGKSGAKKGAVLGGVAGTVFDIATRNRSH